MLGRTHKYDHGSIRPTLVLPGLIAACFALLTGIGTTDARAAKLKVSATVVVSSEGTRIQVGISSRRSVSASRRPRSVKVLAAGKTVNLKKKPAITSAAGYGTYWVSGFQTGDYAEKLTALGGRSMKVTITARSGKTNLNSKTTVETIVTPAPAAPTPTGPLFTPPTGALTGVDAFNYLSKYFLNSAFSDCTAPWPSCAVEQRYVHCPDYSWEYHRNTPTSGSDIHSYSSMTITGATVNADGSWAVSYQTTTGGQYYWTVGQNGIATGQYTFGSGGEALGPMYWTQPAITWQQPGGAC